MDCKKLTRYGCFTCLLPSAFCLLISWFLPAACAAQLPSVFRGVVVADSPVGVRVVSVDESSQADLADLRPDDVIVRIGEQEVRSIDEFAALSSRLKGRATATAVLVFRSGRPLTLTLHLYSYPVLRQWGVQFVPEHDLRFAEARVGLAYWRRLGRGFEEAGKPEEALNAYLNGLHNVPTDADTALTVSALFLQGSRRRLQEGALAEGLASLQQGAQMLEKLFDAPLTAGELEAIRDQLQETLRVLRHTKVLRATEPTR